MIYFDVLHPYYLPQYLPVAKELQKRSESVKFVIYSNKEQDSVLRFLIEEHQLDVVWVDNQVEALEFYISAKADWVIFGNAFSSATQLKGVSRTALMEHGIGPKSVYYTVSESDIDVRFVEGQYRLNRLQEMFPDKTFIDTGYAKLDPVIQGLEKGLDITKLGLDPNKPTLLYAPTFYPSSIQNMAKRWPEQFSEYNILLKPHYFSLTKPSYQKQKELLEHWSTYENVYLAGAEEANLLPFMVSADILISDASSALFEFAALGKPVVWCDFYYLRWSYRGIFKFRFKKRIDQDLYHYADVAAHAKSYDELKEVVEHQIAFPESYQPMRERYTEELAGIVDGNCSQRVVDYLLRSKR